ncbi:MAG TPA: type II toxin-antitoxin system Phd/YefM family antitoxin [Opitutaceae bacterium]
MEPSRTADLACGCLDTHTHENTFRAKVTVKATKARNKLHALIDEANESHDPIQITRKRGNAVLIAEENWRAIRETLCLHSIPDMVKSIRKARKDGIAKASDKLDW